MTNEDPTKYQASTPLVEAIFMDNEQESLKWIAELIEAGEDLNAFDYIAQTIPIEAAWRECVFDDQKSDAAVNLLLNNGVQVEPIESLGFYLTNLFVLGPIELTIRLMENGFRLSSQYRSTPIDEKTSEYDNLLTELLKAGLLDKVELLKPFGILELIDVFDDIGDSPLSSIASEGDRVLAEWLLKHGADINAHSESLIGSTALERAVENRHLKMIEFLLNRGANPNIRASMWKTVTERVSEFGSLKNKGIHDSNKDSGLIEIKRMVLAASKNFPPPMNPDGSISTVWPPDPKPK
ncbi:MAG: ankyrin repeat domain-containing protein [Phycisphaerales bacterium]|nr:ankyrin repeat domain-containing protein [Phycisphaerales bacterium]